MKMERTATCKLNKQSKCILHRCFNCLLNKSNKDKQLYCFPTEMDTKRTFYCALICRLIWYSSIWCAYKWIFSASKEGHVCVGRQEINFKAYLAWKTRSNGKELYNILLSFSCTATECIFVHKFVHGVCKLNEK